jgi:hypothetical protein
MRAFAAIVLLGMGLLVSGCVGNSGKAPAEEIAAARFSNPAPAAVSLITMVNARTDFGEHSALLINGTQQIIYDPAGSFRYSRLPRRDDVVYGITPHYASYYYSYHARFGYYVKVQTLHISREEADAMIAAAQAKGHVPKLFCATAISDVLNDFPQFSDMPVTFFPGAIMKRFARNDAVDTLIIREHDIGQNYRTD